MLTAFILVAQASNPIKIDVVKAIDGLSDFIFLTGALMATIAVALSGLRLAIESAMSQSDDDLAFLRYYLLRYFLGLMLALGIMVLAPVLADRVESLVTNAISDKGITMNENLKRIYDTLVELLKPVGKSLFSLALTIEGAKQVLHILQNWADERDVIGEVLNKAVVMGALLAVLYNVPNVVGMLVN